MKLFLWISALLLCAGWAPLSEAGDQSTVYLTPGQSFRTEDRMIVCIERQDSEPIVLRDCQIWDDFNKKCLFEQSRYLLGELECVEDCQHWDSFNERCDFQTRCTFEASSASFVQKSCEEFDSFAHKCVRQKERLLRAPASRPAKP